MISDNSDIAKLQEERLRDALRLAQTKLNNLEESLQRLHTQQNGLRRHHQLSSDLKERNNNLFVLNKEFATLSHEAQEMERFETFESIQTPFLRMQMLEDTAMEIRRRGQELEQQIHDVAQQLDACQKRKAGATDRRIEAARHYQDQVPVMRDCLQHRGAVTELGNLLPRVQESLQDRKITLESLQKQLQEVEERIVSLSRKLENTRSKYQSLESHQTMIQHSEAILIQLDRLAELANDIEEQTAQRNEAQRRQVAENEMLGRVWAKYQDIEQQIQSLQDEIGVHRTAIKGLDSYNLQDNAMKLKTRYQMLLAAGNLWKSISTGYGIIEEKNQTINALRIEIEHTTKSIQELTQKVGTLRRLANEKEYSFNISKSQNVIKLRSDLQEGSACAVCGATHHPYHSDTILDQTKLISDFRAEYEMLSGELTGQERQLEEMKADLQVMQGKKQSETNNLEIFRLRQEEDVREWKFFTTLDPTFSDCNSSTNREARTAMLGQLTDNTLKDSQQAQEILNDYNYHQQCISSLSLRMEKLESEKDELTVRMGELNTGCQVMAGQVERIDSMQKNTQEMYFQLYELLRGQISLFEWYEQWEKNHEKTRSEIQMMAQSWQETCDSMTALQHALDCDMTVRDLLKEHINTQKLHIETEENLLQTISNAIEEHTNIQKTALNNRQIEAVHDELLENLSESLEIEFQEQDQTRQTELQKSFLEGQLSNIREYGRELDERCSLQRSSVDTWIHAYNASHPPVQYSELAEVLTKDIDWNVQRQRIRNNMLERSLEQSRIDALEAELIALEAVTGTISSAQVSEQQVLLISQIEELESKRRDVIMQIARMQLQLTPKD